MYKTIKRKDIFKGRIIDVKEDTVILPDGKEAKREVVLHSDASAAVAVDPEGKLLFVEQYRHPIGANLLELPAGLVEDGEDPKDCIIRELEEETAFIPQKTEHLISFHTSAGFSNEMLHIYLCSDLIQGKANPDDDEFLTLHRLSLSEALSKISSGEITDSKTIIGLLYYNSILKERKK